MENKIVGIISLVIAIIFGVLSLVTVYPQGRQWLVDTIKKIIRAFVPSHHKSLLTSDQIAKYLECKYENTKFHIASQQADFYRLIARELISSIKQFLSNNDNTSPLESLVRVGLICGPMTFRTADWINKHRSSVFKKHDDFSKVIFVAMNKAAETDSFKYSANYLVAFFSSIFPGSQAIAYTSNPYDKNLIDYHRTFINILLCSAGSRNFSEQNYIDIWCSKMKGISSQELILPSNCIGDFCLTPIDVNGHTISEPAIFKQLVGTLDPYPLFERLGDIKDKKTRPKIIFPVSTFSEREKTKRYDSQETKTTGKEMVTKAVLHTDVIDTCILT
jgi:hypothetical protein